MNQNRNRQLRLLTYGVIAYLVLAFGWWSILLFTKNDDAFQAKKQQMILVKIARGEIQEAGQIEQDPEYISLENAYQKQERMIMGEVVVFVVILIIGLWLIHNGYNKEIRSANQRRNFLLSITHELKSPIASIRLVLDTIRKRELQPAQKELLVKNGLTETERLHQLVNNLLLSARLESAYQPNNEMIDLPVLLEKLTDQTLAKHPKTTLSLDIEGDVPFFQGDQMGMTSVILNLLENAVKYSPSPAHIAVRLTAKKEAIQLEIADQGIGISEKDKKQVFEKFYRVGNEDTRKTKGTGLGLYIVKQLIEAHGGSIRIKDNSPQGTIFDIELPTSTQKTVQHKPAKQL